MRAILSIDTWYGKGDNEVEIVKETPNRYLIRIIHRGTLCPGGNRPKEGTEIYVDKKLIKQATS